MTRENPNPAAFFFDNGDFLNLDDVQAVVDADDVVPRERVLLIYLRGRVGSDHPLRRRNEYASDMDRQRLRDALAVYHSKA